MRLQILVNPEDIKSINAGIKLLNDLKIILQETESNEFYHSWSYSEVAKRLDKEFNRGTIENRTYWLMRRACTELEISTWDEFISFIKSGNITHARGVGKKTLKYLQEKLLPWEYNND